MKKQSQDRPFLNSFALLQPACGSQLSALSLFVTSCWPFKKTKGCFPFRGGLDYRLRSDSRREAICFDRVCLVRERETERENSKHSNNDRTSNTNSYDNNIVTNINNIGSYKKLLE